MRKTPFMESAESRVKVKSLLLLFLFLMIGGTLLVFILYRKHAQNIVTKKARASARASSTR